MLLCCVHLTLQLHIMIKKYVIFNPLRAMNEIFVKFLQLSLCFIIQAYVKIKYIAIS
jgi:hypothetical protein